MNGIVKTAFLFVIALTAYHVFFKGMSAFFLLGMILLFLGCLFYVFVIDTNKNRKPK